MLRAVIRSFRDSRQSLPLQATRLTYKRLGRPTPLPGLRTRAWTAWLIRLFGTKA